MKKPHALLFLLLCYATSGCAAPTVNKSDFDIVCDIVKENIGSKNPDVISEKVLNALEKNSKAAIAFKTVATVDSAEKYNLFKQIAEQETGKAWDCLEMEKLNRENR